MRGGRDMWMVYVDGEVRKVEVEARMCPNCYGTNEGWREICKYCGKKLIEDREVMVGVV